MVQEIVSENRLKEERRDRNLKVKNIILQAALMIFVIIAAIFMYKTYHEYNSVFSDIAPPANISDASVSAQPPSSNGVEARAAYGQYGDFIGGSLNPILSFMSLIAVLFTVSLQITELQQNREELRETREVAVQQKRHFENEAKKTEIMQALQQYESEYEQRISVKTDSWSGGEYYTVNQILNQHGENAASNSFNLTINEMKWGSSAVNFDNKINSVLLMMYKMDKLLEEYGKVSTIEGEVPLIEYYRIKYKYHAVALSAWRGNKEYSLSLISKGLFKEEQSS
ncbi:hypothetical protein [Azospirillum palustre]|uniref:hypothetical protein n=1 Tax=Azospirillum palustre TaxID=2044885 RepID=UPI0011779BAC|nr:hypothetical protein [Azospirillum palustre]